MSSDRHEKTHEYSTRLADGKWFASVRCSCNQVYTRSRGATQQAALLYVRKKLEKHRQRAGK